MNSPLPTTPPPVTGPPATALSRFLNHWSAAITIPALIGVALTALSVVFFEEYGWGLFILLPVIVGFISALFTGYRRKASITSAFPIALASMLFLGLLIVLFAMDGLICLVLALPLSAIQVLIGAAAGISVSAFLNAKASASTALLLCAAFPFLVGFEHATEAPAPIREVQTSVLIDAPIEDVWEAVVAFPKITDEPDGLFKYGIAYPIEARIDGIGEGAIRYCVFSTGSFVEPITTWDEPNHLAFDVIENPPPMKEWSIYDDLDTPHLHGFMVSKRGQFKLIQEGRQVRLEGTTWYSHSLAPEFYWGAVSDEIIHRIHLRVLNHIKEHTEANTAGSVAD